MTGYVHTSQARPANENSTMAEVRSRLAFQEMRYDNHGAKHDIAKNLCTIIIAL